MILPLPLRIALRYSRARGGFLAFVSNTAAAGLALSVAVLVIVLSVMNGFERELRTRILGVLPHAVVGAPSGAIDDWSAVAAQLRADPRVAGVAPLNRGPALAAAHDAVAGVSLQGVLPEAEAEVSILPRRLLRGDLDDLQAGRFNAVVGAGLARRLDLEIGQRLTLVMPDARMTLAGLFPRQKRLQVVGIFEVDAELDDTGVYVHLDDARRLLRVPGDVAQLRLRLHDLFEARTLVADIGADPRFGLRGFDWQRTHGNLYAAIALQKRIMFVLLSLLVAVAAFNVVSMLTMVVANRRADIAMLRTLGMRPRALLSIFVAQGGLIAAVGIAAGVLLGVLLALALPPAVETLGVWAGRNLLAEYFVRYLPVRVLPADLLLVTGVALVVALAVTWWPARRALRIEPAEELRYE